jgi:hypothetical protein
LTDSPVGLAAWIIEKFHTWSDNGGNLEASFSKDELLTNIMLYWVSGAIGSSFWPYYARQHEGWPLPGPRSVDVPMGYCGFPKDILHPPRSLAERAFPLSRAGRCSFGAATLLPLKSRKRWPPIFERSFDRCARPWRPRLVRPGTRRGFCRLSLCATLLPGHPGRRRDAETGRFR